ncbi:hypothetical protein DERP_010556 [Dermatophagoides pteronyssinus]|uniref:Uncharacterized protein n=1 Tax=Dermatophagoides pteronyssinus TaxID=6956 RepID=A0ABQ8JFP4_DERPT|nr:hypothetical protein DERP_010556 [Dermatophagoides pteronyssinus]
MKNIDFFSYVCYMLCYDRFHLLRFDFFFHDDNSYSLSSSSSSSDLINRIAFELTVFCTK